MSGRALDRFLTDAVAAGGLADLARRWQAVEIRADLPAMAGLATAASLGAKLRGALGATLLAAASPAAARRAPCDWAHTCSLELLFGRRPRIRLGGHDSELARPFVFTWRAAADGGLTVILRLFGAAAGRAPALADSLAAALAERVNWPALAKDGDLFLPADRRPVALSLGPAALAFPAPAAAAEMVFVSPLDAARGDPGADPALILPRLLRRLALLAPWCGVDLAAAHDGALTAALADVAVAAREGDGPPGPARGGHRRASRLAAPPRLTLSGDLTPLWPALVLGQAVHIGRGASLGLGRYTLVPRACPAGGETADAG